MDYFNIYNKLIEDRMNNPTKPIPGEKLENHHYHPKCWGGTDDESNMVMLTVKEHLVAHHLLWRWCDDYRLKKAYMCVKNTRKKYLKQIRIEKIIFNACNAV